MLRFNFAGHGNCSNFCGVIKEVTELSQYRQYFVNFNWPWYMPKIGEYRKIASGIGFKDLTIWEENADRFFRTEGEMVQWIDQPSIVPFLNSIDEKSKKDFRDNVVNRMIIKTRKSDGTCFETFRRINVIARK